MDFLKKHFDKVALAVALLLLIAAAGYLAMKAGDLGEQVAVPTNRGQPIEPVNVSSYVTALDQLKNPKIWDGPDMFRRNVGPTIDNPQSTKTNMPTIVEIRREPFKLLFKDYSYDPAKQRGYNFQINLRGGSRSYFVREISDYVTDPNDPLANTGYKLTKYERKTTNIVTAVGQQDVDVSEITLSHEGEKPIVLVYNREAEEQEPVALIMCWGDAQQRPVRRGQRFNCGGATYIVVDINSNQMIIVDTKTEKQEVIPLSR